MALGVIGFGRSEIFDAKDRFAQREFHREYMIGGVMALLECG